MSRPAAAPSTWERIAPLPTSNGGFVSAVLNGEVVIAGGTTWKDGTKVWLDQVHAYDPRRDTWREAGRLDAPLAYAAMGQDDEKLWFASGTSGVRTHRSLWEMDQRLSTKLVAPIGRGFVYAASARIGTALYVIGGTDDAAALERVGNTVMAIDLPTGEVIELADYPEAGVTTATAAAVGDRLFVFGGARWDPGRNEVVNLDTAYTYSLVTKRWEPLPRLPHPGRGFTAITLDQRHILVAGGYRSDQAGFVADALLLNVDKAAYAQTLPLPYAGMVGLVKADEWLYCMGGEDRKKHRTDAAYRIGSRQLLSAAL